MTMIGNSPTDQMMREEAARQKAREDWAYQDEMRKLRAEKGRRDADEAERAARQRALQDWLRGEPATP